MTWGAGAGKTFRRVILPMAWPAVVAGSIFTFSLTLGDYITPQIVSSTQFIGNVVYTNVGVANNLPLAAAFATVPVVIMIVYLSAPAPGRLRVTLMQLSRSRALAAAHRGRRSRWRSCTPRSGHLPVRVQRAPHEVADPGFTLEWFDRAFHNPGVREALWTSLKAATGATLIALLLGTLASFAVARYRFFGRETISFLVILPIALPGIVTGMALNATFREVLSPSGSAWACSPSSSATPPSA